MKTDHILYRHGGRIVSLDAIEHMAVRRQPRCYFVGTVEFDNGGHARQLEIEPSCLIVDGDRAEVDAALRVLNEYLAVNGRWTPEGWLPHQPHGIHDIHSECWVLVP